MSFWVEDSDFKLVLGVMQLMLIYAALKKKHLKQNFIKALGMYLGQITT